MAGFGEAGYGGGVPGWEVVGFCLGGEGGLVGGVCRGKGNGGKEGGGRNRVCR